MKVAIHQPKKGESLGIALDDFKPGEWMWYSYNTERGPIFTKIKPYGVKGHIEGGNTPA